MSEARTLGLRLGAAPLLTQIAEEEGVPADSLGLDPSRQATGLAALSPREREVLRLIAAGHTNNVIAAHLSLSVRTIERHIANLYRKIDARGKADATAYAFRHDLV